MPQLLYVAAEIPVVALGSEGDAASVGGLGLGAGMGSAAGDLAWRPALRAAMILAVPAGVLCSGLTPIGQSLGLVWMLGAAFWAVNLYTKQMRQGGLAAGRLSMGAGARIGLVTGLLASWLTVAVNGAGLWVARFVLHQGGEMDTVWLADVEKSLVLSQQMVAGMGVAAAQAAQSTQASRAWMLSAEGRAGIALSTFLAGAAFLVLIGMLGGAMGARFLAPARRPNG